MGNDHSQPGIKRWLQTIVGRFTAVTGFVAAVVSFVQLWQGNTGLVTPILLAIAIGSLLLACLYYVRFWQPEKNDTGLKPEVPSNFAPQEKHDEYEKANRQFEAEQAKTARQREQIRRVAWVGLIAVPLLSMAGFTGWYQWQNRPSTDVVILVAEFDGVDEQNYRVTDTILSNLRDAVEEYPDVKVKALGQPITEREGSDIAHEIGEKNKADILIWGWYGKTDDTVAISTNFEVFKEPEYFPDLGDRTGGQIKTASLDELNSFALQTQLSSEMASLTIFTLGMAEYSVQNGEEAIARFSDALEHTSFRISASNRSIIYYFRGNVYAIYNQDYEKALLDYDKAIEINSDHALTYNNRGLTYSNLEQYEKAIADYEKAIQLDPEYALAYNNRGWAYSNLEQYEKAIAD
ncbi:MAG: tetratricopeptide repeat protein, partial [Thainema sp.]